MNYTAGEEKPALGFRVFNSVKATVFARGCKAPVFVWIVLYCALEANPCFDLLDTLLKFDRCWGLPFRSMALAPGAANHMQGQLIERL